MVVVLRAGDRIQRQIDETWYECAVLRVHHSVDLIDVRYSDDGEEESDVGLEEVRLWLIPGERCTLRTPGVQNKQWVPSLPDELVLHVLQIMGSLPWACCSTDLRGLCECPPPALVSKPVAFKASRKYAAPACLEACEKEILSVCTDRTQVWFSNLQNVSMVCRQWRRVGVGRMRQGAQRWWSHQFQRQYPLQAEILMTGSKRLHLPDPADLGFSCLEHMVCVMAKQDGLQLMTQLKHAKDAKETESQVLLAKLSNAAASQEGISNPASTAELVALHRIQIQKDEKLTALLTWLLKMAGKS